MSLAHLHLLLLKHIYIRTLSPFLVCNQDTPYTLAYATVVSIAYEHKLLNLQRKKKKRYEQAMQHIDGMFLHLLVSDV